MPRRGSVVNLLQDRDDTPTIRSDTSLRDIREARERFLQDPNITRPAPRPRAPRPHDRHDLDDDLNNLPWQHRSRDFR